MQQILQHRQEEMRYVATPKALKDYNNDETTTITEDLTTTETRISVTYFYILKC